MPDVQPVDQDYKLWVLLDQVYTLLLNTRDQELSKYGTTAMQAAILWITNAIGDKTTPAQISRWILRKPSSITGILDRMEKTGLVQRTKDLDRKNLVRVRLTDKGRKTYKQSLKRESIHKTMSCLSGEERQQLTSSLEKLRNRASKIQGIKHKIPFP